MLQKLDDHFASFLVKYGARGGRIEELMWPEDQRENHPIQSNRRLGDKVGYIPPFLSISATLSVAPASRTSPHMEGKS